MSKSIVGHQQILQQFNHAIASKRVAGAYLFAGPTHVGKETVAVDLARSMNCLAWDEGPCGACLSCRKIEDGNHPDVHIIRPSGAWTRIDQIRALQKQIVYRPFEGKQKVYILAEAERMNQEAANCLLKTLEEPPPESVLILLTANLAALLPTVRSRCQIINFHPMQISELAGLLMQQFGVEREHAVSVATLSGGAVGKALALIQGADTHSGEDIPEIITTSERLAAFRLAEELSQRPEELDLLVIWYRDLLLLHQGAPDGLLTHIHAVKSLRLIASHFSRLQLQSAIKTIFQTKELIKRNVNATLALEVMALKLLRNVQKD